MVTQGGASPPLAEGLLLAGRYRVVSPLGAGGMGVVYRVRDEELGVEVALKVLRPDQSGDPVRIERFRKELLLGREVSHPNVVRIHDIGEHEGLRFLTMRLVEGTSLAELIARGPLEPSRALAVFRQVAEGLAVAHAAGVVHRDLKPANILVDPLGSASISDFGLARSVEADRLTRTGTIVGTLDYLSPEQIAGAAVDGRSDLYALGIVLFEMLTGCLPFADAPPSEMLAQRLGARPRELSQLGVEAPAEVRRVLARCLERDPARRYPDARAMLDDLDGRRGRSLRLPPLPRLPRAAVAAILALAVVLLAARIAVRRRPSPARPGPPPAVASVAVLPFADETSDPELAWTSTGLAEMIAARLAEDPSLRIADPVRVLATSRDLRLVPGAKDEAGLRSAGSLFSVDRIVTGSVRKAGRAVRIDLTVATLGGAGLSLRPLAGESSTSDGLFRLAADLAKQLRSELGTGAGPRAEEEPPLSTSHAAARAFAEGRTLHLAGDDVGASRALEAAVAADPRSAAALELLAAVQASLGQPERAAATARRGLSALGTSRGRLACRLRARLAETEGRPEEAERVWAELLSRYPNDTETRVELAAAQAAQGHHAEAAASLAKVVEADPNDGRALYLLARSSILSGDADRAAHDYLVRALAAQTRAGNEKGRADVLNASGVAYQRLGEPATALASYTEALEARRRVGDPRGVAATLSNRSTVLAEAGRWEEAEEDLAEARRLLEVLGDARGLSEVHDYEGGLHEARGEYPRALASFQEALRLRRGLGDEGLTARSYDNVGYVHFLLGAYDDALVYWKQGLALRRKAGEREGILLVQQNMGFLELAQGRSAEAFRSFGEALDLARKLQNRQSVAVSLGSLGILHRSQGRFGAALDSIGEAIRASREAGSEPGVAEYTLREAETLFELRAFEEARSRVREISGSRDVTGNHERRADLLTLTGRLDAARGELRAARAAFADASREAAACGSRVVALRVRIAETASIPGSPAGKVAPLESALREADAIGHAGLAKEAAEALAEAALEAARFGEAEAASRRGLEVARRSGFSSWKLHSLLSRVREAQGDAAEAALHREAAGREIEAAAASVPARFREAFEASFRRDRAEGS